MHKRFIYENVNSNIFIILYKKPISYTFHQATLMSHDEAILSGGGGEIIIIVHIWASQLELSKHIGRAENTVVFR